VNRRSGLVVFEWIRGDAVAFMCDGEDGAIMRMISRMCFVILFWDRGWRPDDGGWMNE